MYGIVRISNSARTLKGKSHEFILLDFSPYGITNGYFGEAPLRIKKRVINNEEFVSECSNSKITHQGNMPNEIKRMSSMTLICEHFPPQPKLKF